MAKHLPASERGFSILELVVSTCLVLVVMASVFQTLDPARGAFRAEPETADLQQRLRVAADALARDVAAAGRGPTQGKSFDSLVASCPPVLPFRRGRRNPDAAGVVRTDAVTLLSAGPGAAQTTIAQALPARSGTIRVNVDPGCPAGDPSCGFRPGTDVLVVDEGGACDPFTVTAVQGDVLSLQHNARDTAHMYPPDVTRIVAGASRTYYLKGDPDVPQLVQYDGGAGADVPVVDHVVGLSFSYFGDPQPPRSLELVPTGTEPSTTYGPRPPLGGENCVFSSAPSGELIPRLGVLSGAASETPPAGLVPLTASVLSDGPWCPDEADPNRVDADLLRVRLVSVALRVEAAAASLRGPAGTLFWRGGTGVARRGLVPDQEVRFDVAPRNLTLRR